MDLNPLTRATDGLVEWIITQAMWGVEGVAEYAYLMWLPSTM